MNKEIEEILYKFDKVLEKYELDKKTGNLPVNSIYYLFPSEIVEIKNYITDLQEENERLKKDNLLLIDYQDMEQRYNDYKSRIDKAIEKTEELYKNAYKYGANHDTIVFYELLNILKGEE